VRIDHLKSSQVDDFGINRKRICDFPLVRHYNYHGLILHRFWDTATYWLKIGYFSYPSLIRRRRSLCSLSNFVVELTRWKLESWCYLLQWWQHDRSLNHFVMISGCDRQADRQTESIIALCIASCADVL